MEVGVYDKPEFNKLLKAYYTEKKLTKAVINTTDVPDMAAQLTNSTENLTLRQSGQLLLGLLRIFNHKLLMVLSELEEFLKAFEWSPKKVAKSRTVTTQLITMNPKKALLALEDNFSVSSFMGSSRESVEVPRNLADVNLITLDEVNFTPRSVKSISELDEVGSVMQIDSPLLEFEEVEPDLAKTPGLSVQMLTPSRKSREKKGNKAMRIRMDNKTTIQGVKELAKKEHLKIRHKEMSLGSEDLFKKPLIDIPEELLWVFNEVKLETFEFGQETEVQQPENEVFEDFPQGIEFVEEKEKIEDKETDLDEQEGVKRCEVLLEKIKIAKKKTLKFSQIGNCDRRDAGRNFYDLLILANKENVKLEQKGVNREIFIKLNKV